MMNIDNAIDTEIVSKLNSVPPAVLTIAGSDCSGGAGIQADLKTFEACGAYGMSVITSLVAENTCGLIAKNAVHDIPVRHVLDELNAIFCDIPPRAIKIGMMHNPKTTQAVAQFLRKNAGGIPIVIDPVMQAKDGAMLMARKTQSMQKSLLPLAYMITPNIPEAELLASCAITDSKSAVFAARQICARYGCVCTLIKGGHSNTQDMVTDLLFDSSTEMVYTVSAKRFVTKNTHGTGCTYSAAIASFLAQGNNVEQSLQNARKYITGAIEYSLALGHGHGPLRHNWKNFLT